MSLARPLDMLELVSRTLRYDIFRRIYPEKSPWTEPDPHFSCYGRAIEQSKQLV